MAKINRNDPCPCGSGKKYKQCCMNKATPAVPVQATAKAPPPPPLTVAQMTDMTYRYIREERWLEAQPLVQKLLKLFPRDAGVLYYQGTICRGLGQKKEAVEWLQQAVKRAPDNADYQWALGIALVDVEQIDRAITAFRQTIACQPSLVNAHVCLANALSRQGRFDEAVAVCRNALATCPASPDLAKCHSELGAQYLRLGQIEKALASFDCALEIDPDCVEIASNGLMASLYYHGYTAKQVFERHLAFARRFEAPLKVHWRPHTNERSTNRRLRIGYVSADLHNHSVANFAEPIITHHDKERFEVFFYYNNSYCDAVTARFQAAADGWRSCVTWSDAQLAEAIRTDQIDILVDLSGHTGGNRLLTFARKPAPIQITWIGYPGTTGLAAMDYRFTDDNIDPPGMSEAFDTERLVRLPATFPFQPPDESPPVSPLPALTSSVFTIACLSNMAKLNEKVVATWSRILLSLPHARLLLGNAGNQSTQDWLLGLFARHGIGAERLVLHTRINLAQILKLSGQIDLLLDTFPYNGATASMFGLWMGVPVVTLRGDRTVARLGSAIMSRFGLPQFIAHDEQDYVDIVLRWAHDLPALESLRQSLRPRMEGIQDDPGQFKHAVEQALIDMWARWCAQGA